MVLNATTLRLYMTLTAVAEIVDQQFTDAITDATAINVGITTDETALKYYSAFLLAMSVNWKELKKTGDTEFFEPNPQTYKDLYELKVASLALQDSTDNNIPGMIVNSDPKYNDTTNLY